MTVFKPKGGLFFRHSWGGGIKNRSNNRQLFPSLTMESGPWLHNSVNSFQDMDIVIYITQTSWSLLISAAAWFPFYFSKQLILGLAL